MFRELIKKEESQSYNNFPRIVKSLCQECCKEIKADLVIHGNNIVMEKSCLNTVFLRSFIKR